MTETRKLRVGVFMGGKSIEREVSFNSGRTVCDHLDTTQYEIIPIFQTAAGKLFILPWHFLYRGKITDFQHRLEKEAEQIQWDDLKNRVDFMYLAVHGRFAEDGTLQGFLEVLGIPYLGSKVFASAVSMNKIVQKNMLRAHGVLVPKSVTMYPQQIQNFEKEKETIFAKLESCKIQPPFIVKPYNEGSSLGVEVVKQKKQLHAALVRAATITPGLHQAVLIEEKIEGMEFTCITITDNETGQILPLPPTEVCIETGTDIFDYDQKYMPGRAHEFTPPRCSKKTIETIQDMCVRVAKILDISNTSRTDGFVTKDGRVVIVDPNTLTGMAPSSFFFREATQIGMSHTQLINHLIETELQQYDFLQPSKTKTKKKIMKEKKLRVAVLLGGNTSEKEISVESGRNIIYKLSPQKYEAIPVFVSKNMELFVINQKQLVLNSTKEVEESLDPKTKLTWHNLSTIADFVFIGLHGGHGENGSVQGALEMLGIPYNGSSVLSSALCADKFRSNQYLKQEGFDVPLSVLIKKDAWQKNRDKTFREITDLFAFPVITKPHDDGCSSFVYKAKNKKTLEKNIDLFFKESNKELIMIEECMHGMELSVGVFGNEKAQALPPSHTIAAHEILSIKEKFLPGAGENQTPAPLPQKTLAFIQRTVEQVYELLDCAGYVRIDCFYQNKTESGTGKERLIILEVNTLPGMTPATCIFHQAAEIDLKPMDFINLVIELGLQKHLTPDKKQANISVRAKKRAKQGESTQ